MQGGLERDYLLKFEWELCSKNFDVSGNFLESCNYHPISEKRIIVFVEMLGIGHLVITFHILDLSHLKEFLLNIITSLWQINLF